VPLLCFAASTVQILTLDQRIARSARPENWVAFSLVFTGGTIAAGVPVTGGPTSPLMVWLVLPAALMASRFRRAVVVAGTLWSLLLLSAATIGVDPGAFADDPTRVLAAAALLLGVAACSLALSENEMQFRLESRFDHLTGLLNRSALAQRMSELHAAAKASQGTVAVVLYDIDRFKRINDVYGHDRGDAVLRETAEVLIQESRSGDLVYRLGGEEFAVVLPAGSLEVATGVAERLRSAVARRRPAGLDVTMSAGVSVGVGSQTEWEALYRRADAALLQAKRAGRNRVVVAGRTKWPSAADLADPGRPWLRMVCAGSGRAGDVGRRARGRHTHPDGHLTVVGPVLQGAAQGLDPVAYAVDHRSARPVPRMSRTNRPSRLPSVTSTGDRSRAASVQQ
jgi:diguanylate cyclase (GGDEF)-like protein